MPVDEFEKDIRILVKKIEASILVTNQKLRQVDEIINIDLDNIVKKYRKLNKELSQKDIDQFKRKNFELLKKQKIRSFEKAIQEFESLKIELEGALYVTDLSPELSPNA